MDRSRKQFSRHTQVAGEEAGEVERLQIRFRHEKTLKARSPCACVRCSSPAVVEIIARSGVMKMCPICSEIAFSHAAQPLSLERFYEGEREYEAA
jgi:hypothetical protein